jgi:hypothetical protein
MPTEIIHQTDLFRPYNDPDDHWDLACLYALAARGAVTLRGVLIDAPPLPRFNPDVEAVAQMNALHGMAVPCVVGAHQPLRSPADTLADQDQAARAGATWLLETLEASNGPAVITVVGSCRDVALAANTNPSLFARQCAGVYLNAGYGGARLEADWELEYNVQRDVAAYRAMFALPCPLYWLPCFQDTRRGEVTEWGTLWWFRQSEILESLPAPLQRYFAYALGETGSLGWFQYLRGGDHRGVIEALGSEIRPMWSTAGLLHAAGMVVDSGGELMPLGTQGIDQVFEFVAVRARCSESGQTSWEHDPDSGTRHLFRVRHRDRYRQAMTRALGELLRTGSMHSRAVAR